VKQPLINGSSTRRQQQEQHDKAQMAIRQYITASRDTRRQEQHRLSLLARIDTDLQLLDSTLMFTRSFDLFKIAFYM
jgi:hypothetical protein